MSITRTIRMTEVEWSAICSAAALHEAYMDDDAESDPDITRTRHAENRALNRLIQKWHAAGRTSRTNH